MEGSQTEAEFLGIIQTEEFFSLLSQLPLYSFATRFLFLQTHATFYDFHSSVTVHCKKKGGKPIRKPYSLLYGLSNPYRNLEAENSQDYGQKRLQNCMLMVSGKNMRQGH
jgi:hypothetical protein